MSLRTDDVLLFHRQTKQSDIQQKVKLQARLDVEKIVRELEACRPFPFEDGYRVSIVGSSIDGFGAENSELDLMLTKVALMSENAEDNVVTTVKVALKRRLYEIEELQQPCNEVAVPRGRVPILKFAYQPSESSCALICDVSIGSDTIRKNTSLMKRYSEINPQVVPIFTYLRNWAVKRGAFGSAKGYLNSFPWKLLVIFFLQQKGILRVLKPNDCSQILESVWQTYSSYIDISGLIREFFRFLLQFQFDTQIVSIAHRSIERRMDKTASPMWIEDPNAPEENSAALLTEKNYKALRSLIDVAAETL